MKRKNPHAVALGRRNKGIKRTLTKAGIEARKNNWSIGRIRKAQKAKLKKV